MQDDGSEKQDSLKWLPEKLEGGGKIETTDSGELFEGDSSL